MSKGLNISADISVDNSGLAKKELQKAIENALLGIGMQMRENAIDEINAAIYDTPPAASGYERTGALRESIQHDENNHKKYVEVGSALEYAPPNELGSSKMKARPFLRPTVTKSCYTETYKNILEAALQAAKI